MARRMREIVRIDEDKCDGCGLCVPSCAEGAIEVIDGKARLVAEDLCDGLGNCLGRCPRDAITIEERPAEEFDEQAVAGHPGRRQGGPEPQQEAELPCGCPGTMARKLSPMVADRPATGGGAVASRLGHWPIQLALVPARGDLWDGADVLIAADCATAAMPDFHERLLAGKSLAVACPKLDDVRPHVAKLIEIFAHNGVRSVTVAHMEVPCCTGIVTMVQQALEAAGRTDVPLTEVTVGVNGQVIGWAERAV